MSFSLNASSHHEPLIQDGDAVVVPHDGDMFGDSGSASSGEGIPPTESGSLKAVPPSEKRGTMLSSVMNLCGTILGASTLSLPSACGGAGIAMYSALLFLLGIMALNSIFLLYDCMLLSNKSSYQAIGHQAYGKVGSHFAMWSVVVQQMGACIAYIKIIGTVSQHVVPHILNTVFWQLAVVVLIITPLLMLRRITSLRYSSLVAVGLIIGFIIVICVDGIYESTEGFFPPREPEYLPAKPMDLFSNLPAISFAFVCHMNVFPVVNELKKRTDKRVRTIGALSVSICFVVYLLVGVLGYVAFIHTPEGIQDDILDNYNIVGKLLVPKVIVSILSGGIGLALVFTYPVLAFELRHSMDHLVFGPRPFSWKRHIGLNLFIVIVSSVVAITVPSVGVVFRFTGATSSSLVVFILPAAYYLALAKGKLCATKKKMFALVQLVVGVVLVPICIVAEIITLADNNAT